MRLTTGFRRPPTHPAARSVARWCGVEWVGGGRGRGRNVVGGGVGIYNGMRWGMSSSSPPTASGTAVLSHAQ